MSAEDTSEPGDQPGEENGQPVDPDNTQPAPVPMAGER
jgi:hypothetical protein